MSSGFRIGGDGFRSPRPNSVTERIRYCKVDGRVATSDIISTTKRLCEECCAFLAGTHHQAKPGFRQRYLDTAKKYGVTPS